MNYNEIKWTDEENIFLKTNINKLTCSEMAKILNRSNSATRRQILRLTNKKFIGRRGALNDIKLKQFKELYPTTHNYILAKMFNKSREYINGKAIKLNIKKAPTYKKTYIVKHKAWNQKQKNHPAYQKWRDIVNAANKSHERTPEIREKNRTGVNKYLSRLRSTERGRIRWEKRNRNISEIKKQWHLTHLHYTKYKKQTKTKRLIEAAMNGLKYANATNELRCKGKNMLKELRKYQD